AEHAGQKHESSMGTILGWGSLGLFAIVFGWYVGAPLIIGERWSDKQKDAIQLVKDYKPTGSDTLYDMIRAYSLKAKDQDVFVGGSSGGAQLRGVIPRNMGYRGWGRKEGSAGGLSGASPGRQKPRRGRRGTTLRACRNGWPRAHRRSSNRCTLGRSGSASQAP